jgi:filamentous hemagglutinin
MNDVQNYIQTHGITDSQLIQDCEANPVFCPTYLRGAGYDPLDTLTTGEGVPSSTGDVGSFGGGSGNISPANPTIKVDPSSTASSSSVEFLDPNAIRFTQDSVSPLFQNGQSITALARGLESGTIDPADVSPIRVVDYENHLYTLDNRRLVSFQAANVDIPAIRVPFSGSYETEFWDKYSPIYEGLKVLIRGVGIWPPNLP